MPRTPKHRRLNEIFGVEPWSEPEPEHPEPEHDAYPGEQQRRERELLENRPPHHDQR